MYGHGAPPPRSEATVITLRVLFTAVGVLCLLGGMWWVRKRFRREVRVPAAA